MIFVLNLRAVGDDKADFAEAADDVLGHLGERMEFAERAAAAGRTEISRLLRLRGFQLQFVTAFSEGGFEFFFRVVDGFAGSGTFSPWKCAELFHQRGKLAVRPDPRALGLFQRGEVGGAFEFGKRGLFQRFNFVQQRHLREC